MLNFFSAGNLIKWIWLGLIIFAASLLATSLFGDRDRSLWIGTAGQGLSHLTRDKAGKEHFRHYRYDLSNTFPGNPLYGSKLP